jgi:hypothetical protein
MMQRSKSASIFYCLIFVGKIFVLDCIGDAPLLWPSPAPMGYLPSDCCSRLKVSLLQCDKILLSFRLTLTSGADCFVDLSKAESPRKDEEGQSRGGKRNGILTPRWLLRCIEAQNGLIKPYKSCPGMLKWEGYRTGGCFGSYSLG